MQGLDNAKTETRHILELRYLKLILILDSSKVEVN